LALISNKCIKAIEIVKELIGLLEDETISSKTGLSIQVIKDLKN
jgi:hypothetical protein